MTARQFTDQPRAFVDGRTLAGAALTIRLDADDSIIPPYANAALSVPLPVPLISDAAGRFPPLWLDESEPISVVLVDADGNTVWDESPFYTFPNSISGFPLDDSGRTMPHASFTFYRSGTNILSPIYGSDSLLEEIENPLQADENGQFVPIFIDDDLQYRVVLKDGSGRLIYDIDEYQVLLPSEDIPPSPPTLNGEMESLEASLDWNEATAGTYPISEYRIYRSTSGGPYTLIATADVLDPREYVDSGLSADIIYRYYVIAIDSQGIESSASNVVELVESASVFPISDWINPGAEMTDLTGWTVTQGTFITLNDRFPPVGDWLFRGGITSTCRMYQRFELDGAGVPLAEVDASNTRLVVDWWGGTYNQTPPDHPGIQMLFRDASLSLIAAAFSGYKDPTTQYGSFFRWDQYQESQTIPPLCRYIDIELVARRNQGTANDAAFDEVVPYVELIS